MTYTPTRISYTVHGNTDLLGAVYVNGIRFRRDDMSFGEGNLHERVFELEMEKKALENLVVDMYKEMAPVKGDIFLLDYIERTMEELGIEVPK